VDGLAAICPEPLNFRRPPRKKSKRAQKMISPSTTWQTNCCGTFISILGWKEQVHQPTEEEPSSRVLQNLQISPDGMEHQDNQLQTANNGRHSGNEMVFAEATG